MTEKSLTLGSLFDGSGGFPLGGLMAGVTPVWASEIEPFPIRVTTKRLPFMKHYGDVSRMNGEKIEPVDIVTFGSPCTDMSIAGKRAGLDGAQSSLFYEAIRIIKEMRCATNGKYPRWICWENVVGAFSSNRGHDFKTVLEAVIGIVEPGTEVPMPEKDRWPYADIYMGERWSVAYRTVDAQHWGVPQRRRRIYLVGDLAAQCAGKVLFESEGLSGYSAEGFRSWQRTAGGPSAGLGAAGGICLNDQGGSRMDVSVGVSGTLRAQMDGHPPCVMAAGFCKECSAQSRSVGFELEHAPTLRAGAIPTTVYGLFLQGHSPYAIAKRLTAESIPTPGGQKKWHSCTVKSILTNEKYKGDALLQKSYTVDFLTKKTKVNEGEIPQYYVENSHPAIVEPAVFEMVQRQMAIRHPGRNRQSCAGIFSSKIKCGDCGSWYGSKVWHSTDKYRRVVWQCNHKFNGGEKCGTPHLDEKTIQALFVQAANAIFEERDGIIEDFEEIQCQRYDTAELDAERQRLQDELNVVAEMMQQCINENARIALDQTEYQMRYDALTARFDQTKVRLDEVSHAVTERQAQREKIEMFLADLSGRDGPLTAFDEDTWYSLVDFVTVYSKENIWTFDSKGELLITIMSSLAQEESRSLSENITWGQRKRFSDGKVSLPYKQFLGYRKGPDGLPEVVEEEAVIVRRIYNLFMEGRTSYAIAKQLTADGIPTPSGKKKWGASVVESILTNEKYKGAALLQKCYTVDFLTKTKKVNEGEVQQYYIDKSHQPIIQPHEFDVVQAEFARRKGMGLHYSGGGVFASRLVCGDCGGSYGPKVWHSNSKYRRIIWQCNGKFSSEEKCSTPHLREEDIKARFLAALDQLLGGKEALLENCRIMQDNLTNCSAIDAELDELLQEIAVVTELTQRCIQENARSAQSQEAYTERYNGYVARYERAKARADALQEQKRQRQAKADLMGGFMFAVHEREVGVEEFDNTLWLAVVQKATVYHDRRLVFTFQNGMEIEG